MSMHVLELAGVVYSAKNEDETCEMRRSIVVKKVRAAAPQVSLISSKYKKSKPSPQEKQDFWKRKKKIYKKNS